MAWTFFSSSLYGNDAKPVDAGVLTDDVHSNMEHLADQSPVDPYMPTFNGAPTSTALAYAGTTDVVWKTGPIWIHSARQTGSVRTLRFKARAMVTGGTGHIRFWVSPHIRAPGAVAPGDYVTGEVTITSVVGETQTVDVAVPLYCTLVTGFGRPLGELLFYRRVYMGAQAIITAGQTLTLIGRGWRGVPA